ncbi:hypothetical protein DXV75_12850 [Alteromonas aestuariivivens]|uniref:DUF998 domain-containing protein n=1 Tax=Alteromonas aestuariivivens TaxID=1938339 RepID=A0A3D8M5Z5_9ALTE|nr:hypothetical protein [Alteromonas aestuariivivens]RDV24582.1 hypothetical protein DXV75_12850 [Alteromonas aestuariivivens]
MPDHNPSLQLAPFALLTTFLPMLTIHLCAWLAGWQGILEWCNPYGPGCFSISATGRDGVAYFIFKGGMVSAMVLLTVFWWLNEHWLKTLQLPHRGHLGYLGAIAALAMVAYTLSLGHSGDWFYLVRRSGVILYLGLTFIIEATVAATLCNHPNPRVSKISLFLLRFSIVILALAMISLLADAWLGPDYEYWENAVEWWLVGLLNLHAIVLAVVWRQHGLQFLLQPGNGR